MIIIIITISFIFIYLLYPLWLRKQKTVSFDKSQIKEVSDISIIYLSQNHAKGLREKILFLLDEISCFKYSELIVVDDASTDGTTELFQNLRHDKLRFVKKEKPMGIPHSMNIGVKIASYQNICFCDQRQMLDKGIIKKLIVPLKYNEVGIVSSCISSFDKSKKYYLLRSHENYIKELEGQIGNLIGVYGPLYALKKEYYQEIPNNIILDDLYLTLSILKNKKAVFQRDCKIFDDNFDLLYSYKRTKRYLAGFFQIVNKRNLIVKLSRKQKKMLFWHKYFRIPIPLLIASSYILLGIESFYNHYILLIFLLVSILWISILLPINLKIFRQMRSIIRFVGFYTVASIELFVRLLILNQNIYEE
jgi:biofilm PGA synthesis N-glycosyltransferase PgaC